MLLVSSIKDVDIKVAAYCHAVSIAFHNSTTNEHLNTLPSPGLSSQQSFINSPSKMSLDELELAELRQAFNEFDKVR